MLTQFSSGFGRLPVNVNIVFFWRLSHEALDALFLLKGINMNLMSFDSVLCVLSHEESLEHLFLRYPFAMACWSSLSLFLVNQEDPFWNLQNSVGCPFLSRSGYSYVLEFMNFKKWPHLSRCSANSYWLQSNLQKIICVGYPCCKEEILSFKSRMAARLC